MRHQASTIKCSSRMSSITTVHHASVNPHRMRNKKWVEVLELTLTLSQWSSSGNPVAIQCAWKLDPSVHWNATGEMPVCFQWSSSGFPVVFQCVPIMLINTGSPLEHHWVLASASVVPVASQCTFGSSGLPVWSVQWYPSVLAESGLEVIRSGHFPACDP